MTKKKQKNECDPSIASGDYKRYVIAAAAVLIIASVIFLIAGMSDCGSAGDVGESVTEQAERYAKNAAVPGVVEVDFLKLDEQGNPVFSGKVMDGEKVLFTCGNMVLADRVLRITGAEIADSENNVLTVLRKLHLEGKKLFPGVDPERVEVVNAKLLTRGFVFSATLIPSAEQGWMQIVCDVTSEKTALKIVFDLQKNHAVVSGSCMTESVIKFGGMFGSYQDGKIQSFQMENLTFTLDRWGTPVSGKLNVSFVDGMTLSGSFQNGDFTGKATAKQVVYNLTISADGKAVASRIAADRRGAEEKVIYRGSWDLSARAFHDCMIQEEHSPVTAEPLLFPVSVTGKRWTRVSQAGEKAPVVQTDTVEDFAVSTSAFRIESRKYLRTHKTKHSGFSGVSITGKNNSFSLNQFDLETVNGAGKITNAGFCMPAGNKVGTFTGTVKEDLNLTFSLAAKGNLCLNNGVVMKDVEILLGGKNDPQLVCPPRQVRGELKKELPFALPEIFSDLHLEGMLEWEYNGQKGLILTVKDSRISSVKLNLTAEKVNFSLVFPDYSKNLTTPPGQKIAFDALSVAGYTFGKGVFSFRMGEKFYLEQVSADWCGGKLAIFSTEFEAGRSIFTADCTNVDFAKFLSQFALGKFSGEGTVSGKLAFLVGRNGAPHLQSGTLQSAPDQGGVLKSVFTDHTVMGSGSAETQRFAMEVLRDMSYAWVTCEVRPASEGEKTVLVLRFNGKANRELPYEINPSSGELKRTEGTSLLPALRMDVDFNINR